MTANLPSTSAAREVPTGHSPLSPDESQFVSQLGQRNVLDFLGFGPDQRRRILVAILGDEASRQLPGEGDFARDRRCLTLVRERGQGGEFIAAVRDARAGEGL